MSSAFVTLTMSVTCGRFFPERMQPFVAVLSNSVYALLVSVKVCKKVTKHYEMRAAQSPVIVTLPGTDAHDAPVHHRWNTVHPRWNTVHHRWNTVHRRCTPAGIECTTAGIQCTTAGIECTTAGIQFTTAGIQCTTAGIQCTTPGIQCTPAGKFWLRLCL